MKKNRPPQKTGTSAIDERNHTSEIAALIRADIENPNNEFFRIGLPDNPWCLEDKAWFNDHPRRSFRFRTVYQGEKYDAETTHVLVMQRVPGLRTKLHFKLLPQCFKDGELLPQFDDDDFLLWVWCVQKGLPLPTQSTKEGLSS